MSGLTRRAWFAHDVGRRLRDRVLREIRGRAGARARCTISCSHLVGVQTPWWARNALRPALAPARSRRASVANRIRVTPTRLSEVWRRLAHADGACSNVCGRGVGGGGNGDVAGSPLREILEGRRRGAVLGKNLRRQCLARTWQCGRTLCAPMTFFGLFSSPGGEKQRTSQITMEAAASVSPHVVKKRVTKVAPLSPPSLSVTCTDIARRAETQICGIQVRREDRVRHE